MARTPIAPWSLVPASLVATSVVFGGGGSVNPAAELVLELCFCGILLVPVLFPAVSRGMVAPDRAILVLAALLVAWPVLQLIPLPPSVWQNLPGRELEVQSLRLIGASDTWMPFSVAPARTLAALLSILSAVIVMLAVAITPSRDRLAILAVIVVMGIVSIVLGALQLSHFAGHTWSLYREHSEGWLIGFQANRNAEVDILQICLLAVAVIAVSRARFVPAFLKTLPIIAVAIAVFLVAIVLTGSRTGIVLLPLSLVLCACILLPRLSLRTGLSGRSIALVGVGLALGLAVLSHLESVSRVLRRFSGDAEGRWEMWVDAAYAMRKVWPVGGGLGSFTVFFQNAERLSVVDPLFAGRAHNDWLETILEGGVIQCGVLIASAALFTFVVLRYARSQAPTGHAFALFAAGTIAIIALHSIVDFPLRTMALANLLAVACGLCSLEPNRVIATGADEAADESDGAQAGTVRE